MASKSKRSEIIDFHMRKSISKIRQEEREKAKQRREGEREKGKGGREHL